MAGRNVALGSRRLTFVLLTAIGVIAAGATVLELTLRRRTADASALPPELSVASLKAQMNEPGRAMDTIRDNMRRDDLTDEQRRQLMANAREVMQATMAERVDEYFAAPEEEKEAVLDKHIDDFVARQRAFEERREDLQRNQDQDRERFRSAFGSMSQQDRKERFESRDADRMARAMTYFAAARNRMKERGIQPPTRPGGRGPRGGGFGP
jgi:hypothetical protein